MNKKRKILFEKILYKGTSNSVELSCEEILRAIISFNGHYFYLLHNHPFTSSLPSTEDIYLTKEIQNKALNLKIYLIDHLIVGIDDVYSFIKHRKELDL